MAKSILAAQRAMASFPTTGFFLPLSASTIWRISSRLSAVSLRFENFMALPAAFTIACFSAAVSFFGVVVFVAISFVARFVALAFCVEVNAAPYIAFHNKSKEFHFTKTALIRYGSIADLLTSSKCFDNIRKRRTRVYVDPTRNTVDAGVVDHHKANPHWTNRPLRRAAPSCERPPITY